MKRGPSLFNIVSLSLGMAFLYLPIVVLVIYSFNASRLVGVWGGWSDTIGTDRPVNLAGRGEGRPTAGRMPR